MNDDQVMSPQSRYPLVGVLAGLIAVAINLILYFTLVTTQVSVAAIGVLNLVTINYGCAIPAVVGGILYYLLKDVKGANIIYTILFSALTVLSIYISSTMHCSDNPATEESFHQVFVTMIIITGIIITFGIPFLATHEKITAPIL